MVGLKRTATLGVARQTALIPEMPSSVLFRRAI